MGELLGHQGPINTLSLSVNRGESASTKVAVESGMKRKHMRGAADQASWREGRKGRGKKRNLKDNPLTGGVQQ